MTVWLGVCAPRFCRWGAVGLAIGAVACSLDEPQLRPDSGVLGGAGAVTDSAGSGGHVGAGGQVGNGGQPANGGQPGNGGDLGSGGGGGQGGAGQGGGGTSSASHPDGGHVVAHAEGGVPDAAADACTPDGCGECAEQGKLLSGACGNCGHYACAEAGLRCENPEFAYVTALSAGGLHSCALLSGGRVRCWGDNSVGELGDGTTTSSVLPTSVDAATDVKILAAGYNHTCVLLQTGAAKCWGDNASGELGDGTLIARSTAVTVQGLSPVQDLVSGVGFSCALLSGTGALQCWGDNRAGQLGDGTTTNRPAPVTVQALTGVLSLTLGRSHACALLPAGVVKCWGSNTSGQLGDGTTTNSSTPVSVQGLAAAAKMVAVGADHSCALLTSGAVQCWGVNTYGQLGNGTTTNSPEPVDVSGLASGVDTISVNGFHSCALLAGTLKCWGFNTYGGLGDQSTTNRSTPVNVYEPGIKVGSVSAGSGRSHTCLLLSNQIAECFGPNNYGQLGDGTSIDRSAPVRVQNLDRICP